MIGRIHGRPILVALSMLGYAIILIASNLASPSTDNTQIRANYPSNLVLEIPDETDLPMIGVSPGKAAKTSGVLVVRANIPWLLQVRGYYGGKMQRVNAPNTVLQDQMRVKCSGANPSDEISLTKSYKNYLRGLPGEFLIPTDFNQKFSWKDAPADYTIKVMFKLSPD